MKKITVIGSGFSGLAAAASLGARGHKVEVYEKNNAVGGRARQFTEKGFVFDMGPSWYWMPEVFERFFRKFGHSASDFYQLVQLSPSFSVFFGKDDVMDIPSGFEDLCALFEAEEPGSADRLRKFMKEAEFKYNTGMSDLVYKPGLSVFEFMDLNLLKGMFRLQVFSSFSNHVRRYFKNPRLIALMEFPVLFLGARPQDTPALYSLMNYAGLKLGTYYPMGGFCKVIEAMQQIASSFDVKFNTSSPVEGFDVLGNRIVGLKLKEDRISTDAVVATADYHHIDQQLLPSALRSYSPGYWSERTMAPSALIFYLGVSKKISKLRHHNLFFDEDFQLHAEEIYTTPRWPTSPLFYVCCPSRTDASVAPEGKENLFILIPLAPGLPDDETVRNRYFDMVMNRIESICGENVRNFIEVQKSYCVSDFVRDYNAFKGNAYGLANTLMQTANLKPSVRSKKVKNLFYAGQLTVPGPGVPPSIISGQIAAQELLKYFKLN